MNTNTLTRISTLAAAIGLALSANVWAAEQTVTYEVQETAVISVSASPAAMTISAATPGSAPTPVTDNSTTYSVTNNAGTDSKKITAAIDTDMPPGVTLEVELQAPDATSSSAGKVTLSEEAAPVVTGIDNVNATGKTITYTLSATAAAGKVASATKTVTFTITGS